MEIAAKSSGMDKDRVEKRDNRTVFALCAVLFLPSLNNFINAFLQLGLGVEIEILTPAVYIFMAAISVFILYPNMFRRKMFLGIFVVMLAGVLLSYTLFPDIRQNIYPSAVDLVYSPVNKLFFFCLPALFGMACISDRYLLFKKMRPWAVVAAIVGIITFLVVQFRSEESLQYMVYSYAMLLPICVCFENARVKKAIPDLIIAGLGTVCILMCGARGALLSLLLYFVIRAFTAGAKQSRLWSLFKFFVLLILIVLLLFFFENVTEWTADLLDSIGVDSRFITSLTEGSLLEDSGRSELIDDALKGIAKNPFGYGLYGDRYATGKFGAGEYTYVHNVAVELLCDFGVVGGVAIIFMFVWRMLKIFILMGKTKEMSLVLVLLPYGLFQLFFSSSYLENVPFFMLVSIFFFIRWKKPVAEKREEK